MTILRHCTRAAGGRGLGGRGFGGLGELGKKAVIIIIIFIIYKAQYPNKLKALYNKI